MGNDTYNIDHLPINTIKLNPDNPRHTSQILLVCELCGSEFIELNYNYKRKYCSPDCYWKSKKGIIPLNKGEKGMIPWNKGKKMWDERPHPRGTLGMKFPNRKPLTADQIKRMADSHRGLKYPNRTGANHHFWKGGITPENVKYRKSAEYKNWRIAVFERDSYTCRDCNKTGGYLHAHHIKTFSDSPSLRFDPKNGETLCMDCHAKRHGLVFSIKALNRCPDCGKRIKVGARRCLPCQMKHTRENPRFRPKYKYVKKCLDCDAMIQKVSTRCRSCAAKINIVKTGYVNFWEYRKCNIES